MMAIMEWVHIYGMELVDNSEPERSRVTGITTLSRGGDTTNTAHVRIQYIKFHFHEPLIACTCHESNAVPPYQQFSPILTVTHARLSSHSFHRDDILKHNILNISSCNKALLFG